MLLNSHSLFLGKSTLIPKISLVHTEHSHPQDVEKSPCTQILKPSGHE